jgi:hypothetical protein
MTAQAAGIMADADFMSAFNRSAAPLERPSRGKEKAMTTAADSEVLTRVGPGTPMGELMQQYWVPVHLVDIDHIDPGRVGYHDIFDRSIDALILRSRPKPETHPSARQIIQRERGIGCLFCLPVKKFRCPTSYHGNPFRQC